MKVYIFSQFLLTLTISLNSVYCIKLTDVTYDLFRSKAGGVVAAFGDFNADKMTDIFILDDSGTRVDLLEAEERKPFVRRTLVSLPGDSAIITGVILADFDGDSFMDVLVTKRPGDKNDEPVEVQVFWGSDESPGIGSNTTLEDKFYDQPALVDWNGDMLPDLLGETYPDRDRSVWLSSEDGIFTSSKIDQEDLPKLSRPHSIAFIDVDNDFNADVVMTTEDIYEVWTMKDGNFTQNYTYDLPTKESDVIIGQSSFADINMDGNLDHLVPVCMDNTCAKSVIYWYNKAQGQWQEFMTKFSDGDLQWGFVPPSENMGSIQFPVTLRTGDYNMDGLPDAIVILRVKEGATSEWTQKAVLLLNVDCSGADCSSIGRTFSPDWSSDVSNVHNVTAASFFDLYEDGVLDMLLVSMTIKPQTEDTYYPQVRAYKQTSTTDACFVKVLVTSGLCYQDCPNGRPPYGVNVPGPSVKYMTTSVKGDKQHSSAGQLSQSAHFALQLPFTLFGLGQTPNFVDKVSVGVPTATGMKLERTWTQIIPNSQLVVIPHPHDRTSWWVMKLFATPSRLVLITGAVLIGTMGFVAGIIGILHWRERREDQKEKRQESHKFHFDAM